MIAGMGIDVVDVARMERVIASPSGPRFVARVFTAREAEYCGGRRDGGVHYAARFAAKEATSKALGVPAGIRFHDVEVVRGEGAPRLVLSGVAEEAARARGVTRIHLSLSHDGGVAVAAVVLEAEASP
jgi:holo-[acyl-carrier protein] synthase